MEQIIAITYILITSIFIMNFFNVLKQIQSGSKKLGAMSLLATSSLVFQFAALAYFFYSGALLWVGITQAYMVICMLYMKFIHKKDNKGQ